VRVKNNKLTVWGEGGKQDEEEMRRDEEMRGGRRLGEIRGD
jgi:hypothetical protein